MWTKRENICNIKAAKEEEEVRRRRREHRSKLEAGVRSPFSLNKKRTGGRGGTKPGENWESNGGGPQADVQQRAKKAARVHHRK